MRTKIYTSWKVLVIVFFSLSFALAQNKVPVSSISNAEYFGQSLTISEIINKEYPKVLNGKKPKPGVHKKGDWPQHKILNNEALPAGPDPVLQMGNSVTSAVDIKVNFNAQDYTGVNPADPTIGVGRSHIVQMVNSAYGSLVEIYDRQGNLVFGPVTLSNITGIDGLGDPQVLYDQLADRWILAEIKLDRQGISYAVSTTADPTGTWEIYSFNTITFPDYQKWSIWTDGYYITTHEDPNNTYVLDRNSILNTDPSPQVISFNIPSTNGIKFHSAAPVNISGFSSPGNNQSPCIVRLMDDAWNTSISGDHIEMWSIDIDWSDMAQSNLSGPNVINVAPYDTNLCGYNNYSCIKQPGTSIRLDPIKEMAMHQVQFRNFGSHQSMVMAHTVDVDDSDRAGIRWYELRSNGNDSWQLHQQGTISPDGEGRFMPSININRNGDIMLAYNISGKNTNASIRGVCRKSSDPLNQMTSSEKVLAQGTSPNRSNRYGDYNHMVIDPLDDSGFFFTGTYNTTTYWSTRITGMKVTAGVVLAAEVIGAKGKALPDHNLLELFLDPAEQNPKVEMWRAKSPSASFEKIGNAELKENAKGDFLYKDFELYAEQIWYYKFRVIDQNDEAIWSDIIALENNQKPELKFEISPNPFAEYIQIKSNVLDDLTYELSIVNVLGQEVSSYQIDKNLNGFLISTIDLSQGIYALIIQNDGQTLLSEKLIKH